MMLLRINLNHFSPQNISKDMNKKLLALGLVGAAAWLFKTKKGNEVRSMIGEQAGKLGQQLKDQYRARTQQAKEQYDETMA